MNEEVIKKIHKSGYKFFVAIAGGGQSFIGDFCKISGASNNLIGAFVPYHPEVFNDFVGGTPDKYVSSEAARKLAVASYLRCLKAGIRQELAIGIGATSSIVKEDERQGREHKSFVATHTHNETSVYRLTMKQSRTRLAEEEIITNIILAQLARLTTGDEVKVFSSDEQDITLEFTLNNSKTFSELANGQIDTNCTRNIRALDKIAIYGGSFNPLHEAHLRIKNCAESLLGTKVMFELTLQNADKGILDYIEVANRVEGFKKHDYLLTRAATIKEKVDVIRRYNSVADIIFVLGSDTWQRMWNPKYGYSTEHLSYFFKDKGVKFLVFNRPGYKTEIFPWTKELLITVIDMKENLSSTSIRLKKPTAEQKKLNEVVVYES